MIIRESDATDVRPVRPERNQPSWPILGHRMPLLGEKWIDQDERRTRRPSLRPHRPCGYGEPKLEIDDRGNRDEIVDAVNETGRLNSISLKVG